MALEEYFRPGLMKLALKNQDKEGVIRELIELLVENDKISDEDKFFQEIMERERKGTTGLSSGVAIPHVKTSLVKEPVLVFGRSVKGVDYEARDNKPSHLFFLIAVPVNANKEYLKLLAELSRMLVYPDLRKQLLKAESAEMIIKAIANKKAN